MNLTKKIASLAVTIVSQSHITHITALMLIVNSAMPAYAEAKTGATAPAPTHQTLYKTIKVKGLDIFYREAGPADAPTILLLHGFPTSSHMFRNLMPAMADKYHVIAPDYPGYGHSSTPSVTEFDYTFDNLAEVVDEFIQKIGIKLYSLYVMDYGAPVGFRIAARHPERVQALIVQNGNAYEEGLRDFWKPIRAYWAERSEANAQVLKNSILTLSATQWQYTNGIQNLELINPENWLVDQTLMDRTGNKE